MQWLADFSFSAVNRYITYLVIHILTWYRNVALSIDRYVYIIYIYIEYGLQKDLSNYRATVAPTPSSSCNCTIMYIFSCGNPLE